MASTPPLTTILSSGPDAFTNLWDVEITFPTNFKGTRTNTYTDGTAGTAQRVSVRASGFTPPEGSITPYTVAYKGVSIQRPGATIEMTRTFDITFRMDANYALYQDLLAWKNLIVRPSGDGDITFGNVLSTAIPNSETEGTVKIRAYSSSATSTLSTKNSDNLPQVGSEWIFSSVVCVKAGAPAYQRADSGAVEVTASFWFGSFQEPSAITTIS